MTNYDELTAEDLKKELQKKDALIESIKLKTRVVVEKLQEEKHVIRRENESLSKSLQETQQQLASANDSASALQQVQLEVYVLKQEAEESSRLIQSLKQELAAKSSSSSSEEVVIIAQYKKELEQAREQSLMDKKDIESLQKQINDLVSEEKSMRIVSEAARNTLSSENARLQQELSALREAYTESLQANNIKIELDNRMSELTSSEVARLQEEVISLQTSKQELSEKLEESERLNIRFQESSEKAKNAIEILRDQLQAAKAEVEHLKSEATKSLNHSSSSSSNNNNNNSDVGDDGDRDLHRASETLSSSEEMIRLREELEQSKTLNVKFQESLGKAKSAIETLKAQLEAKNSDATNSPTLPNVSSTNESTSSSSSSSSSNESLESELEVAKNLNAKFQESLEKAKTAIETLKAQGDAKSAEIEELKEEANDRESELKESQELIEKFKVSVNRAKEALQTCVAEKNAAEALVKTKEHEIEELKKANVEKIASLETQLLQSKAALDLAKLSSASGGGTNNKNPTDALKNSLQNQLAQLSQSLAEREKTLKDVEAKLLVSEKNYSALIQTNEENIKRRIEAERRAQEFEGELKEHKKHLESTGDQLVYAADSNASIALKYQNEIGELDRQLQEEKLVNSRLRKELDLVDQKLKKSLEDAESKRLKTRQFVESLLEQKKKAIEDVKQEMAKTIQVYETKIQVLSQEHEKALHASNSQLIMLQDELQKVSQELSTRARMSEADMNRILQAKEDELQLHKNQRKLAKNEAIKIATRVEAMTEVLSNVKMSISELMPVCVNIENVSEQQEKQVDAAIAAALAMRNPNAPNSQGGNGRKGSNNQPRRDSVENVFGQVNEKDPIEDQIRIIAAICKAYLTATWEKEKRLLSKTKKVCEFAVEKKSSDFMTDCIASVKRLFDCTSSSNSNSQKSGRILDSSSLPPAPPIRNPLTNQNQNPRSGGGGVNNARARGSSASARVMDASLPPLPPRPVQASIGPSSRSDTLVGTL